MTIVLPTLHVRRSAQAVPLAAACLAAALPAPLRSTTHLPDFFPDQSDEDILAGILAFAPDLVAFPIYVWNRRRLTQLARQLKKRQPSLRLVAGGPEATADSAAILAEGTFDALVCGEGEIPFAHLLATWQESGAHTQTAGIIYKNEQDVSCREPHTGPMSLDELPSPWLTGTLVPETGQGVLWEISRGCPFGCDFCFDARGHQGVRPLSFERLRAELDLFVRQGVAQVWVLDSTFNYPPERGKALLRLLADKAPHVHFHLEAKADFLDRETARLLTHLSCSVQLGLQSANPKVLRQVHRSLDLELFTHKVRLLAAEGVTFGLDLIYGLPTDDYAGFTHSLNTALSFAPNHLDIFPLAVLPGTPLYRNRDKFGLNAQTAPPYEILSTATLSAGEMEHCRDLAAATDLFYNLGRAVGFFQPLLTAMQEEAVPFLENFASWAMTEASVSREEFRDSSRWTPSQILELQEGYIRQCLKARGRGDILPAALDMVRYHFHYAETLLGEETTPADPEQLRNLDNWNTPWQRSGTIRLVPFSYEILDLLEMGEMDLERIASLFRPIGSVALFARRGPEVLCESLVEDFLKLLQGSDGQKTPREIFAGSISRNEGEEILEFAVSEGLLVPSGNITLRQHTGSTPVQKRPSKGKR
ncbi:B12-binding domain-containing radical SAM protein [Desulfuromonas sp. AOP6]|uniref:B12-binding domain-containing radical SAM protein n=1 Tax=Desulfuromonas sp. AOP6 TaxID=1566351 RepID=UPI00126C0F03|nr:B12-binding domain-containing radical SAM protein [Desulfuromonas sp. AOP6]BCA80745.1 B12-binding domain-containing radical SAM protein [Desulfuromonas sp. AOP6]